MVGRVDNHTVAATERKIAGQTARESVVGFGREPFRLMTIHADTGEESRRAERLGEAILDQTLGVLYFAVDVAPYGDDLIAAYLALLKTDRPFQPPDVDLEHRAGIDFDGVKEIDRGVGEAEARVAQGRSAGS